MAKRLTLALAVAAMLALPAGSAVAQGRPRGRAQLREGPDDGRRRLAEPIGEGAGPARGQPRPVHGDDDGVTPR